MLDLEESSQIQGQHNERAAAEIRWPCFPSERENCERIYPKVLRSNAGHPRGVQEVHGGDQAGDKAWKHVNTFRDHPLPIEMSDAELKPNQQLLQKENLLS